MERISLDTYGKYPPAMLSYLQNYGKHFSKRMYEFAIGMMWKKTNEGSKEKMKPTDKETFGAFLKENGVKLENDILYDGMYVLAMAKADFMGRSIEDDHHLALFVKDYIDDVDAVDGQIFNRFYADCMLKGIPIDWENML